MAASSLALAASSVAAAASSLALAASSVAVAASSLALVASASSLSTLARRFLVASCRNWRNHHHALRVLAGKRHWHCACVAGGSLENKEMTREAPHFEFLLQTADCVDFEAGANTIRSLEEEFKVRSFSQSFSCTVR